MKVWSRSNIIGILLLLLLAGDVETNPGPTTGMVTLDTILVSLLAKHLGTFRTEATENSKLYISH